MAARSRSEWDVAVAVSQCPVQPWSGSVWRCHARKYAGDDATGSLKVTGRFNRGRDKFANHETWPALYTRLAEHVALGERLRHTSAENLQRLAAQRLSRLQINLSKVLNLCAGSDCSCLAVADLDLHRLCQPRHYEIGHQIAVLARTVAEALLVPSCTQFPEGNLIIFPDRLGPESILIIEETHDPDLYIDWSQQPT